MMGRQISFYMDENDVKGFVGVLGENLECVLFAARNPSPTPLQIPSDGAWPIASYICRSADIENVRAKEIPGQGYWLLGPVNQPLVEFSLPRESDGRLRAGRAYYQARSMRDGGQFETKPEEFIRFAESVRRLIRKHTAVISTVLAYPGVLVEPPVSRVRVGRSVGARVSEGSLTLLAN